MKVNKSFFSVYLNNVGSINKTHW